MSALYRLLTLLLTPLALLRLQRGETCPGAWRQRLGQIGQLVPGQIWVHAASVGEINAAQGLIDSLLARGEAIVISTMTVTGAARSRTLFGKRVEQRYLALDNPLAVRAWLRSVQPRLGLIIETEIWPELFARCREMDIPLLMVSARLSEAAQLRYQRFRRLFAKALSSVALATCQTEADATRLARLGLATESAVVTGNLKFDLSPPGDLEAQAEALRSEWGQRPVWTAGSARPGEEQALIAAHDLLCRSCPEALLVLAPRHPDRTEDVARLLERTELAWCRYGQTPRPTTQVILVDRLGVLMACYAAAQVAFVGGSLVPLGGHNLLEPAVLGRPVLAGPHLEQQVEAAAALESAGGLIRISDAKELGERLVALFQNPAEAERIGHRAYRAMASGRGSLERTLQAIEPWLGAEKPT